MIDQEDLYEFINSNGPIRVGCYIEYYRLCDDNIAKGTVIRSTYSHRNEKKKNHVIIIEKEDKTLLIDNAKTIYPRLTKHIPGEESINEKKQSKC